MDIDDALQYAARELGLRVASAVSHGWNRKSASAKFTTKTGTGWFRVQVREKSQAPSKLWTGVEGSEGIRGVRKPKILAVHDVEAGHFVIRVELTEYVPFPPCSSTPEIKKFIALGEDWLETLRSSLVALEAVKTDRVSVRQDLVSRRISERFGSDIPTQVASWATIHGDMHWANVTYPQCWILDWEGWGTGPKGLDICFLYCFSLLVPEMKKLIADFFGKVLESESGRIGQLFAVAELLRMVELYGDHPTLKEPLLALGHEIGSKR